MGLFHYNIEKYSPKQLVIIPMVLLAISLVVLAYSYGDGGDTGHTGDRFLWGDSRNGDHF